MTKHLIKLPNAEWEYDDSKPLGKAGGFGEVFLGSGDSGAVAIKRLKINAVQAAHRELKIGQELMGKSFTHIVPILDAGQDSQSDRYFLVMPVCEFNLQDKIDEAQGSINETLAISAITEIIAGLLEVPYITHRDLKPANVLFHEGAWKIADFGIAKFIEDATSKETLRNSLTPKYAAPEQWKGERPSTATDIYALGCIAHALYSGAPPFCGTLDEIREGHLHKTPEQLSLLPARFSAFITHMLRKPPNARPTLERCGNVFSQLEIRNETDSSNTQLFDEAAKQVAKKEAEIEAENHATETLRKERNELFSDANAEFLAIRDRLFTRLKNSSESVNIAQEGLLRFGEATLNFTNKPQLLQHSGSSVVRNQYNRTGWDVLGWTTISLACASTAYVWSATLLFADIKNGDGFRWYEIAFWQMVGSSHKNAPFSLDGYESDIDIACGTGMHSICVAYGPSPLDCENEENFISSWVGLIAKAATGILDRPSGMPVKDFR